MAAKYEKVDVTRARREIVKIAMVLITAQTGSPVAMAAISSFLEFFNPELVGSMLMEIGDLREASAKYDANLKTAYEAGLKQGREDRTEPDVATAALLAALGPK